MYFNDRLDAANQLASKLKKYENQNCVVLAIPRGGVPIGCLIAQKINCPFDLMMTKKIGHPNNPEYAIGAVSLEGVLKDKDQDVTDSYFDYETKRIRKLLQARYKYFMKDKKPINLTHKIVIIVDDGIATGYTLLAALDLLKAKEPEKIVIAVPVAPPESAELIKEQVDEFICLYTPTPFYGVGRFYENFAEVSDKMVFDAIQTLTKAPSK